MILYMTLQRLMGRKSFRLSGDFTLVMRDMKVWFMFDDIIPKLRIDKVASTTLGPIVFQ